MNTTIESLKWFLMGAMVAGIAWGAVEIRRVNHDMAVTEKVIEVIRTCRLAKEQAEAARKDPSNPNRGAYALVSVISNAICNSDIRSYAEAEVAKGVR